MADLIVVMGVSGCGKSTVGLALSKAMAIPFFDADNYHPVSNREKMKAGIPLEDNDRIPWLEKLNQLLRNQQQQGAILACSALKDSYRTVLSKDLNIKWVYLKGSFEVIQKRMQSRNHFMPPSLLQSQFDTLEEPKEALILDIEASVEALITRIKNEL